MDCRWSGVDKYKENQTPAFSNSLSTFRPSLSLALPIYVSFWHLKRVPGSLPSNCPTHTTCLIIIIIELAYYSISTSVIRFRWKKMKWVQTRASTSISPLCDHELLWTSNTNWIHTGRTSSRSWRKNAMKIIWSKKNFTATEFIAADENVQLCTGSEWTASSERKKKRLA